MSKWTNIKILPNLVFKKKPEYKKSKLEVYPEFEEEEEEEEGEEEEEEEEENSSDNYWSKTDESEEDESKTLEKKARKNCTNCEGTDQCYDGEKLEDLRPGKN